jgi:pyridoxamine 5'-phosphate oxidase
MLCHLTSTEWLCLNGEDISATGVNRQVNLIICSLFLEQSEIRNCKGFSKEVRCGEYSGLENKNEPVLVVVQNVKKFQMSDRREYLLASIEESELAHDPIEQFQRWYQDATEAKLLEPNALVLATVDATGRPAQRTVLLKYYDRSGMVFFTNYGSRKGRDISANPTVSMLFQWLPQQRQLEINGRAERISAAESFKYFAMRPRGSQLGAWVSEQSSVISSRQLLESKWVEMQNRFRAGKIPLPKFWGGFRVVPHRFEFWQGRENRLHDRFEYLLTDESKWIRHRLAP